MKKVTCDRILGGMGFLIFRKCLQWKTKPVEICFTFLLSLCFVAAPLCLRVDSVWVEDACYEKQEHDIMILKCVMVVAFLIFILRH